MCNSLTSLSQNLFIWFLQKGICNIVYVCSTYKDAHKCEALGLSDLSFPAKYFDLYSQSHKLCTTT